ncbi:hypothetical protein VFPPC_16665 [Pochonia chlamydosporia 170]|uniref:Uncharacterized protein n=1 Tax=Pochonia chlamydosporia 170 TaxID=1380566 RepID=A0A179F6B8_METCM|nr:hypothetical protein VFPPC_16665 [Pochonia chlamydosporia 170]OAQ60871.1 hypothetical protein VFPPC_16665 [Pochonia chlamydosporia 170]
MLETERRLGIEKLDREHKAGNQMTGRQMIRRSGLEAILVDAEATVELSGSIMRQLARQENALLECVGTDGDMDEVMKKRQAARTEAGDALHTALMNDPSGRSSKSIL